jgi:hypothetical protein
MTFAWLLASAFRPFQVSQDEEDEGDNVAANLQDFGLNA